jgi:hypothetical protein
MPGLPYGIPMVFGGGLCGLLAGVFEKVKPVFLVFGVGAITFGITGICMILFWLFGGSIVGFWFMFGSWEALADLALARVLIAPSTVMITALVTLFLN